MLKRKNSSFNMLLDSTSSMMRTASSTFQCFIGSARRASFCGHPDPSVQLAPNANSGSLYLKSNTMNSNESSLSNISYDEQRRRVTIYDGRIPSAPVAPAIPFELMTPIDAITHTIDDPVESFVQIVLETPDDRPLIMPRISSSPTRADMSPRNRYANSSPRTKINHSRTSTSTKEYASSPKPKPKGSTISDGLFNASQVHFQPSDMIEPMDFSFLESVLGGESSITSIQPPPVPPRTHSLHSCQQKLHHLRELSEQEISPTSDSSVELHLSSHSTSE
jgi:hypothetical protein